MSKKKSWSMYELILLEKIKNRLRKKNLRDKHKY
jgi:hypothetical protein